MIQNYVCHVSYKGKTLSSDSEAINYGEALTRQGDILYYQCHPVCFYRSLIAKQHFAPNDDGQGLERGALSYLLAYTPRRFHNAITKAQQRFTDEEIEILTSKYSQFLKADYDVILFNDSFFEQSPQLLREIAQSVGFSLEDINVQNS